MHVRGSGATIVLLPGTGGDASQFDTIAPTLSAAGYRTLALSVRGAGRSEGPLDGLTLRDYAEDVAGVIGSLGAAPVHVLGRAGGNRVARMLATIHPDLVASVILVNAGVLVPADPSAWQAMMDWGAGRLPDAGHALLFEQPRRVADEVLGFLRDLNVHSP